MKPYGWPGIWVMLLAFLFAIAIVIRKAHAERGRISQILARIFK
jgi:hypothetical protein